MNRFKMLNAIVICVFIVQLISPVFAASAQVPAQRVETGVTPTTGSLPISFHYVKTFGETGIPYPSAGQEDHLNIPAGIYLDATNHVYLVETGGKRLWSMDSSAVNTMNFPVGVAGQNTALENPQDVALYDGKIWVADWNRLVIYNADGTSRQEVYQYDNPDPNQPNWFDCATGLSFDAANRLYVVQACGSNEVLLMAVSGAFPDYHVSLSKTIGKGSLNNPVQSVYADLTGSSPALFVTDDSGVQRCSEDGGSGDWNCVGMAPGFQGRGFGLNPADPTHIYVARTGWSGQGINRCDDSSCSAYIVNPDNAPQILFDPVDIAFDTTGNAFVTDRGDATVKKFLSADQSQYSVFKGTQFSPYISADLNFNDPVGVAITPDYGVLILERQGQRLTKLFDEGDLAWNFGQAGVWGNDYNHTNNPEGNPAVDTQGRIYFPDRNNSRVVILSSTGTYLGAIGNQNGEVNYQLNSPSGVAIGPNGDIYVANQDSHNIKIYTADRFYQSMIGNVDNNWGADNEHFNRPSGIAVANDQTVFVSDMNNQRVQKCTRSSPSGTNWTCETFVGETQASNNDPLHLDQPASLAWDKNAHRLYVADQNNSRVQVFGEAGDYLATIGGEYGHGDGLLANPMGLAVDEMGALYIADPGSYTVQKFIPVVEPTEFAGQTGGPLQHMVKDGAYLYSSAGPRLDVFNLANPDHPVFVGESDLLPFLMSDLSVQGNYAYLTFDNNAGFAILDLTDKTHPVQIGSLLLANTTSVTVKGSRAYVGSNCCSRGWSSARLFVVDVSDKANPVILNYLEWGDPDRVNEIRKIVGDGTGNGQTIYIAAGNEGVVKVDVSGVTATVAPIETGRYKPTGDVRMVDLALNADGSLAFVADQGFGLRAISTSTMGDAGLDSVDTRGYDWTPNTINLDGNTVITTAGRASVGTFDVSTPTSIPEPTRCFFFGSTEDAIGSGSRVYLARFEQGLTTSPLPDCSSTPLDEQTRPISTSGTLATLGDYTYQATWEGGLRILDTSDPAHPRELSVSNLDTSINDVEALTPTPGTMTYAYLVTGFPGQSSLRVMNVTDPAAPSLAGSVYDIGGTLLNTLGVRQVGASVYAYIPEGGWYGDPDGDGPATDQFNIGSFRVIDVTDPMNIQEVGQTGPIFDGQTNDTLFYNNYALVTLTQVCDNNGNNCVGGGVRVIDISDPAHPNQVSSSLPGLRTRFMDILDGRLYIAAYDQGLLVWDISSSDPNTWFELGSFRSKSSSLLGVAVEAVNQHVYAYVSDNSQMKIYTLDVSYPASIVKIDQSIPLPGKVFDLNRIGNYILVSAVNAGLYTFWVTPQVEAGITTTSGDSLISDLDGTTYSFQAGDVARDLRLLHTPILGANAPEPQVGRAFIGHTFSNSATDAVHDRPMTSLPDGKTYDLTIGYEPTGLDGVGENTLGLYYWSGSAWVQEASNTNTVTHTLTAHPNHFSLWSVQGWSSQELPSGTLSVGSGNYTASSSVSLTLSAISPQSSVTWMRFSNTNNGSDWTDWEAYSTAKAGWALEPGDGVKTVYVQFKDLSGNLSNPISDSITLDKTNPVGSLLINGGAAYATSASILLSVDVTDANPGLEMSFSNDESTWSEWEAYTSNKGWSTSGSDGSKTVWTRFKDAAGNVSSASSDTILLDTAAPTGSITINGGASVALTHQVLLTLPASDATSGVSQMVLSNDGSTWTAWDTYNPSRLWTLSDGDGAKTVYARYQDNAGLNSSIFSANITLDSTPPTGGVAFHNSPTFTNQSSIMLDFTTSGTPYQMRYTEQSSHLLTQAWTPFANQVNWDLGSGDGVKNVFAQFKNEVGNPSAVYSTSTILDTTAPTGSILVNGGMGVTASPNVTLVLPTTETGSGVAQMMISNAESFSDTSWELYSATKSWTLTGGDGSKTVYAKFKDQIGNVSSVYSDSITLDSSAPSGSAIINDGQPSTINRAVTLTITANGGANSPESMMISNDATFTGSTWQPYATSLSWTLSEGYGSKSVFFKLRDSAGNISTIFIAEILFKQDTMSIFLPLVKQ
ncbi:MAG: hypothetical protein PHQ40_16785 [Anaerolineaceae bacterium]|nr:hypothetical protein [Anaerolineaceae bacterium]